MTKKQYIIALGLAFTLSATGYAANPASTDYVDAQVNILKSQIAAIPAGKQGPPGAPGAPGAPGTDGVGGVTTAGAGVSVTGSGSVVDPYIVSATSTPPAIGTALGGGKVACTLASGGIKNLIATAADKSPGAQWSQTINTVVPSPGAISMTNGRSNTLAAYTQNVNSTSAVQICYELNEGGYQDWYLPARDELNCVLQNRTAIGGFSTGYYWSSTESGAGDAWTLEYFSAITPVQVAKFNAGSQVRCVRAFAY